MIKTILLDAVAMLVFALSILFAFIVLSEVF
jgi:hypothetical protein